MIYASNGISLERLDNNDSKTYERLVNRRLALTGEISGLKAKISLAQERLNDLNAADTEENGLKAGAGADSGIAERIQRLREKQEAITKDFAKMLDAYSGEQVNDKTVSITEVKYQGSSFFSKAFLIRALITAGPLCALGFMACVALLAWSRRKE